MADEKTTIEYEFVGTDVSLTSTTKKVDKSLKSLGKTAEKTKKAVGKEAGLGQGLEALKGIAESSGGRVSEVAGIIEKLGRAASTTAAGGVGALVAGVAIAAAGLGLFAAASVNAVRSAEEYRSELLKFSEIKDLGFVGDDGQRKIKEANEGLDRLTVIGKGMTQTFASEVAPAVEAVTDDLVILYLGAKDLKDAMQGVIDVFNFFVEHNIIVVMAGLAHQTIQAAGAAAGYDEVITDMANTMAEDVGPSFDEHLKALEKDIAANEKAAAAAAAHNRELEAMARKVDAANDALRKMSAEALSDTLSSSEAINSAYDARAAKILDLAETEENLDNVSEALAENEARRARDLEKDWTSSMQAIMDIAAEMPEDIGGSFEELGDIIQGQMDDIAEDARAKVAATVDAVASLTDSILGAFGEIFSNQVDTLLEGGELMEDGQRKLNATEKEALMVAFRNQQRSAIVQATIAGALAVQQALASPAGFPANAIMAAAVGIDAAVNIAAIARQEAPTLAHSGHSRVGNAQDESLFKLRSGEAVLSPQGRMAAGGSAGVDALNGGNSSGGSVAVQWRRGHKLLARDLVDISRAQGAGRDLLYRGSDGRNQATVMASTGAL